MLLYSSVKRKQRLYGRVVELVDSLDSGSSVHCGRAGSSPASPTKETVERLSLFCQSILAKTNKTPMFPIKTEAQGIFCFIQGCVVYLQVFLSVFVVSVDGWAAECGNIAEIRCVC